MATVSLRDEVTELLQELIRIDTTNPPGNETAAAEVLRRISRTAARRSSCMRGCPSGRISSRGSPAAATGRRLLFLSHTDVVLADAAEWTRGSLRRRAAKRRDLGPRGARHEGTGRGERCCDRLARARRLRACGRPHLRRDRRRGGGRRLRRAVAVRDPSRRSSLRLPDQRGIGRAARARWQAVLHRARSPRR